MANVRVEKTQGETVFRIQFSMNGQEWTIVRSRGEILKMHVELHLEHFALATRVLPDVHWFRSPSAAEFQTYFQSLLGEEKLRTSDSFSEFAEISAASFLTPTTPKPILEGYAKKRRGGRRFMLRGCSLAVGGFKSFFRSNEE